MILGEFLGHFDVRPIAHSISSNRSSNATGGPAKLPVAVSQEDSAIFHRRSACRESHGANAETCPAHARALDWSQAGRLSAPLCHALFTASPATLSPEVLERLLESDRSGLPARTLAAHCGDSLEKICANAKNLLARSGNPCNGPSRSSGVTRSPHNQNKEEKKKEKHECYRCPKGNVGNH